MAVLCLLPCERVLVKSMTAGATGVYTIYARFCGTSCARPSCAVTTLMCDESLGLFVCWVPYEEEGIGFHGFRLDYRTPGGMWKEVWL